MPTRGAASRSSASQPQSPETERDPPVKGHCRLCSHPSVSKHLSPGRPFVRCWELTAFVAPGLPCLFHSSITPDSLWPSSRSVALPLPLPGLMMLGHDHISSHPASESYLRRALSSLQSVPTVLIMRCLQWRPEPSVGITESVERAGGPWGQCPCPASLGRPALLLPRSGSFCGPKPQGPAERISSCSTPAPLLLAFCLERAFSVFEHLPPPPQGTVPSSPPFHPG